MTNTHEFPNAVGTVALLVSYLAVEFAALDSAAEHVAKLCIAAAAVINLVRLVWPRKRKEKDNG